MNLLTTFVGPGSLPHLKSEELELIVDQKTAVIACEVLRQQIESFGVLPYTFVYLEQGLHRTPKQLKERLQAAIDKCNEFSCLILGYGLCSRAVIGLRPAPLQRLIIPKADDCIAISMGSRAKYFAEFKRNPGTYYFTKGWIEAADNPLKEYYKTMAKFDEEAARWAACETLKHYHRTVLIKTSNTDLEPSRIYVKEFAEFFNLQYDEIWGELDYLKKLLLGPWDDDFVIVEGVEITDQMFE